MEGTNMKVTKRLLAVIVIAAVMVTALPNMVEAKAKTKPVLNKKKVTLTITNTKKNPKATLKVKGVSNKIAKKAKWTTSNKKVVTIKKGKVTAKKAGKVTITCKVQNRRLTCKITVKDKRGTEKPDNGVLKVEIKSLGSDSISAPGVYERLQLHGNAPHPVPKSSKEDPTSPYTEENVNTYKTTRSKFFSNGEPYLINSKIVATYNGKDVTNKASYMIQLNEDVGMIPQIPNGMVNIADIKVISAYDKPKLIAKYNGVEKSITIQQTIEERRFTMCYCGELFDPGSECDQHQSALTNEARATNDDKYLFYVYEKHGGCWIPYYKIVTLKEKEMAQSQRK